MSNLIGVGSRFDIGRRGHDLQIDLDPEIVELLLGGERGKVVLLIESPFDVSQRKRLAVISGLGEQLFGFFDDPACRNARRARLSCATRFC